jgi:Flp pilus assembly protein TadD
MATKSSTFYIQKFLLPAGLHPLHPYEHAIQFSSVDFWPHVLIVAALVTLGFSCIKKFPWASFCIFFYFATLLPSFFNFRKGELDAVAVERYAYIPSIGLLLLLVIPIAMLVQYLRTSEGKKITGILGTLSFFTILTILSFRQTRIWDSAEILFARGLAIYPQSVIARTEYARTERELGNDEQAFAILKEGLKFQDSWLLHKEAGLIYAKNGDTNSAREQFTIATNMAPKNPEPVFYLGALAVQLGDEQSAKPYLEKAVALDPSYVVARVMLGTVLMHEGDLNGAKNQFVTALQWYPYSKEAMDALAELQKKENK